MSEQLDRFSNCMCTDTRVGRVAFPVVDPYLLKALAECGDYCHGEMMVQERLVRPGSVVLDVGANIGLMSLHLSRLVGEAGTVHAFEPSPFAFGLLRHNLEANGVRNVLPRRAAVSEHSGRTEFADPDPEKISRFNFGVLSLDSRISGSGGRNVETEVVTVDSLDLEYCAFIKVDVEGFEAAVVRGAARTIERCLPVLSLEIGDPQHDGTWLPFLRGLGYRIFGVSTFIFTAPNFKGRAIEGFPMVVCVNAFALPPGMSHMELLDGIPREEFPGEAELQAFNSRYRRGNLQA
ncbi:FkbM family methyltransferase [Nisaea sediminum]|uniref:FkbM family methyltransferase n=1 Tax=Nisaea sediminum TaxID=2775867 RepID=UPI001867A31B|nr:FkbM family methyltransferase [Nisaea sediminum]